MEWVLIWMLVWFNGEVDSGTVNFRYEGACKEAAETMKADLSEHGIGYFRCFARGLGKPIP